MNTRTLSRFALPALPLLGMTLLAAAPSQAVTLEQKWQAGQQLNYDFAVQGDATFQTDAPGFPLVGVPVPIKIKGDGTLLMNTTEVDAKGSGTLVPKLAPFSLHIEAMGQKLNANFKRTTAALTWNDRVLWTGPNAPLASFKISRLGKLEEVAPLTPPAADNAPAPAAPHAAGAAPAQAAKPKANPFGAMMQDMILRALPAFWPGRDLKEGDTWTADFPHVLAQGAAPDAVPAPDLGKMTFKLGPEEKIGDRTARRVSVVGELRYQDITPPADEVVPDADAPPVAPKPRLDNAMQKINGNLWFDPQLGQVVRAELDVQAGAKGSGPARAAATPNETSLDFTGTVQMQLKSVTDQPAATPAQ